jgi:hypothetical protein
MAQKQKLLILGLTMTILSACTKENTQNQTEKTVVMGQFLNAKTNAPIPDMEVGIISYKTSEEKNIVPEDVGFMYINSAYFLKIVKTDADGRYSLGFEPHQDSIYKIVPTGSSEKMYFKSTELSQKITPQKTNVVNFTPCSSASIFLSWTDKLDNHTDSVDCFITLKKPCQTTSVIIDEGRLANHFKRVSSPGSNNGVRYALEKGSEGKIIVNWYEKGVLKKSMNETIKAPLTTDPLVFILDY